MITTSLAKPMELPRLYRKLTNKDLAEIIFLYVKRGWKEGYIAQYKKVNRALIHYHVRKLGLMREVGALSRRPPEVQQIFNMKRKDFTDYNGLTYKDYLEQERRRSKKLCAHPSWIRHCRSCGGILDSSHTHLIKTNG